MYMQHILHVCGDKLRQNESTIVYFSIQAEYKQRKLKCNQKVEMTVAVR